LPLARERRRRCRCGRLPFLLLLLVVVVVSGKDVLHRVLLAVFFLLLADRGSLLYIK
jgi:hypothetical protein